MERQSHARIARKLLNAVPVIFSGNTHGTGTLYELSTGGCKIETASTPPLGASLKLRLTVSPNTDPVKIDAAIVGWTIKDQYFGVKFLQVEPTDRLLLDQCIANLAVRGSLPL
ncbi:PilZ domain-containing protein [Nitrospira sp. Nam74]